MKQLPQNLRTISRRSAFTLIELLVVIAVMAILAGLIFPVVGVVNKQKVRSKARAELSRVQMAIDGYKDKLGFYPPSSPGFYHINTLYYELNGVNRINEGDYQTLDKSSNLRLLEPQMKTVFGPAVGGIMNAASGNADEGRPAVNFLSGLRADQVRELTIPGAPQPVKILVTSVRWKGPAGSSYFNASEPDKEIAPICFNSSNPTNNPNSYDLWVDVFVNGKTNRISNWSKEPTIL